MSTTNWANDKTETIENEKEKGEKSIWSTILIHSVTRRQIVHSHGIRTHFIDISSSNVSKSLSTIESIHGFHIVQSDNIDNIIVVIDNVKYRQFVITASLSFTSAHVFYITFFS
jgi:hypothetical protein